MSSPTFISAFNALLFGQVASGSPVGGCLIAAMRVLSAGSDYTTDSGSSKSPSGTKNSHGSVSEMYFERIENIVNGLRCKQPVNLLFHQNNMKTGRARFM